MVWRRIRIPTLRHRRIVLAAYFAALVTSTHIPGPMVPVDLSEGRDKWVHGTAYFVLAALTLAAFPVLRGPAPRLVALHLGLLMAVGAIDELTQAFVTRTPSWGDWICDSTGVVLASLCGHFMAWLRPRPRLPRPAAGPPLP